MLTEAQKRSGRRDFLRATATLPAVGAFAWQASSLGAVKAGIIGTGVEGQVLMKQCNPDYMKITAVCDILPSNLAGGLQTAKDYFDPNAQAYSDYRELLQRGDIEAVIVATPLWLHAPITIAALEAGKHVFCEMAMAKTVEECRQMNETARSKGKILQIGHQRFYNPVYHQAYQLLTEGIIGDIYHARCLWHQNSDWRREINENDRSDGAFDPAAYQYGSIDQLVNWRLYKQYSGGLASELMSHQIAVANWVFQAAPVKVSGVGVTSPLAADNREVYDHIYCAFEYPNDRVVTYSSIQSNSFDDYYEQFMGTKGTLILSRETESYLFWESGYQPEWNDRRTRINVGVEGRDGTAIVASTSRPADSQRAADSQTQSRWGMNGLEPYQTQLEGFAHSIRTGAPVLCTGEMGMSVVAAVTAANQAMETGTKADVLL